MGRSLEEMRSRLSETYAALEQNQPQSLYGEDLFSCHMYFEI